jgi:hypothetical protein
MAKEGGLSSIRSMFDNPSVRAIENVLGMASSRWFDPSEPPAPQPADIYPGKYNKCKYTPLELAYTLALTPGTKADLDYLFELGKADGAAWAAEVGLSNPAACSAGVQQDAASSNGVASGVDAVDSAGTAVAAGSIAAAEAVVAAAAAADAADVGSSGVGDSAAAAAGAGVAEPGDAYGPFSADIVVGSAPAAVVASSVEAVGQHQLEIAAAADADAFTTDVVPHVMVQLRQQHRLEVAAAADAAAASEAELAAAGSDAEQAAAATVAVESDGGSADEGEDAVVGAPDVPVAVDAGHANASAAGGVAAGAAVDSAASPAAGDSIAAATSPADEDSIAVSSARSASKRIPFWLRSRG